MSPCLGCSHPDERTGTVAKRMTKKAEPPRESQQEEVPVGYDMIRFMAGLPVRQGALAGTRQRHVITIIQRDALGRVVGSKQQIEESEVESYELFWIN